VAGLLFAFAVFVADRGVARVFGGILARRAMGGVSYESAG